MLADQALVSAMNFLTTALLARILGIHNFGIFSVLYIVLQFANCLQLSLIVSPMLTLGPQLRGEQARTKFLRGMAGYQLLFSLSCSVLTGLVLLAQRFKLMRTGIGADVFLAFAVTIFCFLVQDWLRRYW